jgi:hypothetical protein
MIFRLELVRHEGKESYSMILRLELGQEYLDIKAGVWSLCHGA